MSSSILFENVSKTFPLRAPRGTPASEFVALRDVTLHVEPGEFAVVVGPSGCGKSTLLDLLAGLTEPTAGRVLVNGEQVQGPGLDRGIVFQQYALLPWRDACGNVAFGLEAKGVPRRERRRRAAEFLDLVGLAGFADRYPHELSGGMRQRVALARSLAFDPDVLLMDEPFAALDAQTRELLQEELLRIWQRTGKTVVFITHSIDEAVYLGQRVAVLSARPGRVREVVDVRLDHSGGEDVRAGAEFGTARRHIAAVLHDTQPAHAHPGAETPEVAPPAAAPETHTARAANSRENTAGSHPTTTPEPATARTARETEEAARG